MVKRALIIFAVLTAIIVIGSIIISIANSRPLEFQSAVSFENGEVTMRSAQVQANVSNASNDIPFISSLLEHERIIMVSSIFIILLFAFLFYGAKRSKS